MVRNSTLVAASAAIIGFGVPALSLYVSIQYGFNYIAAAVISLTAIVVGGALIFFGIVTGPLSLGEDQSAGKLRMFRAHLRATLEEMDEIIEILTEIRDLLRGVE